MEIQTRWQKVAHFVEKALEDEDLRKRIKSADEAERLDILNKHGFSQTDIDGLKEDFGLLYPDIRTAIQFW